MDLFLTRMITMLGVAILVAIIARRLHLPYTVGLVLTGIGLAIAQVQAGTFLSHEFIFDLILPPLLFEAAISMQWKALRLDMLPIFILSTFGVLISAALVAAGMVQLLHWPLKSALIFGVLIAATDPIAVIAMFKDIGVKGRLRLLIESESLFNDGVAAVLFALVLGWVDHAAAMTAASVAHVLILMAGGGIAMGLVCAAVAIMLIGRTTDYLIETTVTTVAAYGSFLLAEHFHLSGVMATVAAGLLLGNRGLLSSQESSILSAIGRNFVVTFWDFAAFIANSLVFLLIGLSVSRISFAALGLAAVSCTIGLVLIGRALSVYPLCFLLRQSKWAIPIREQHVLWWGGLRGALALALALALPRSLDYRNQILVAAFAVVIFSVVAQGLTMPWLLRRLRLLPVSAR
jgi:CPA1 family monovalent cation:H+ antiporter